MHTMINRNFIETLVTWPTLDKMTVSADSPIQSLSLTQPSHCPVKEGGEGSRCMAYYLRASFLYSYETLISSQKTRTHFILLSTLGALNWEDLALDPLSKLILWKGRGGDYCSNSFTFVCKFQFKLLSSVNKIFTVRGKEKPENKLKKCIYAQDSDIFSL